MRLWVNGVLLDDPQAPAVSPVDHGITVGDGAFETLKVVDSVPFALTRHLDRLEASARGLGLPVPDRDLLRAGIAEVLAGWNQRFGRMRITYTGGPSPIGSERLTVDPTLLVALVELPARPPLTKLVTVPWVRNERGALTGLKTTSYAENVIALEYAHQRDGSEALFGNSAGMVCEGTGSNVFVVLDGHVLTPPLSSGCLAGVTRALVLEWFGGIEQDIPLEELGRAEEIFLTSTTRDVQAVAVLDDTQLAAPGPFTVKAMEIFAARSARDLDP